MRHLLALLLALPIVAHADEPAAIAITVKDVEPSIDAIVALHRKGVVVLASTDEGRRDHLDIAGRIAFDERTHAIAELRRALIDELDLVAAGSFKPRPKRIEAFLEVIEERPDLHDGDKLAFQSLISDLVDALASTPGDGPRRDALRVRLVADRDAIDGIAARYRVEAKALLDRTRGMVVTRELWNDYVAFVRSVYSDDRVLADYATDLDGLTDGLRAGKRRTDSVLEIYGYDLPDHTFTITFDDGPDSKYTPQILDILARYDVRAEFFQVGERVVGREALTQRIVAEGHLLGNHTLQHKNLPKLDDAGIVSQIDDSRKIIEEAAGRSVTLFRPPYGARDARVLAGLEERGERAYIWNVDSRDWADPLPESIAASVLDQVDAVGRGVILFHDTHAQTVAALPLVLDGLVARGVNIVEWDGTTIIGAPVAVEPPVPAVPTQSPTPATAEPAPVADPTKSRAYKRSWAVVIGVDEYQSWPKLAFAEADARGMKDVLISRFGFAEADVTLLINGDATREDILRVLGDELPGKVGPDDRVFVFYAGHGATRELPGGGQRGYIVPVDAPLDNLQSGAIAMSALHDIQEGLGSKHVFFVMDACYGGLALTRGASASGGDPARYLAEITRRPARQILTAGGADEQVADYGPGNHSIFTWTVLQGLDGQADLNGDGAITASELGSFVSPRVSSQSRQTPAFGNMVGSGGGEFVFELEAGSELLSEATQPDGDVVKLAAEKDELVKQLAALRATLATVEATRGADPAVESERYHKIGIEFFRKGDYEHALEAFKRAVELDPKDVRAVNNLGYTYFQLGNFIEAVRVIKDALALDPERAVAWLNLGDALAGQGDKPAAREAWTKYLALVPDSPERERLTTALGAP